MRNVAFTERFTDAGGLVPATRSADTYNTDRVDMDGYERCIFQISVGNIASSATLNVDIYEADAASGGNTQQITSLSITELGDTDDDAKAYIEVTNPQLDTADGFTHLYAACIVAGGDVDFGVNVLREGARFEPVDTSAVTEIVK